MIVARQNAKLRANTRQTGKGRAPASVEPVIHAKAVWLAYETRDRQRCPLYAGDRTFRPSTHPIIRSTILDRQQEVRQTSIRNKVAVARHVQREAIFAPIAQYA
ncbi:hypothetical protein C9417_31515 [Rhizobium sp. SEMIA 4088]|nr:hypothetical protein C9E91_17110 [Rhizobium sp. SEMIA4064]TGE87610.1 hypothetical protein C9417_31515 [Rhizobium sp. SEMIA 4088]